MKSTEAKLIELYNSSRNSDDEEECNKAKLKISLIIYCFKLISIFTKIDHVKIIKQLYFDCNNIATANNVYLCGKTFASESTFLRHRKKYCSVTEVLIADIDYAFGYGYDALKFSAFASDIK